MGNTKGNLPSGQLPTDKFTKLAIFITAYTLLAFLEAKPSKLVCDHNAKLCRTFRYVLVQFHCSMCMITDNSFLHVVLALSSVKCEK
jgi:hypothetical protein